MKIIFSNFSDIYYAFFRFKPSLDKELNKLGEKIIRRLKQDENGMGFALKRDDSFESKVLKILEDYDPNLPPDKLDSILEYVKEKREAEQIKQRSYIQIIVTLLLLPLLLFLLSKPELDETTKEAIIGFIGIIIGYWLR
jgi:hypothetical protein